MHHKRVAGFGDIQITVDDHNGAPPRHRLTFSFDHVMIFSINATRIS